MSMAQINQIGGEDENQFGAIDLFGTWRRRKWLGIAVGFIGVSLAVTAALAWPATYRSTATILIEEPDVPDDLVKSTVSTFADERLQVIEQRVMTTQNLGAIIDRFGLYADQTDSRPRSEIIARMRDKIDLSVVSADLFGQQSRSSQNQKASIAFNVSFDYKDPQLAQQVASRLADLYLAENAQTRQEKAAGTTEFLAQQSQMLLADVQALEQKLTTFKSRYAGSLPEQLPVNMQILDQVQTQLMQNRRDLEALAEKKAYLQSQLSQLSPYTPMTSQGQAATPQAQLMSLELQYVDLSAKYGPKHPDVVHVQKQIESLKAQIGTSVGPASSQARLSQLQQQLSEALQRYGEQHPEVQKLRKQLADLQTEIGKGTDSSLLSTPKGPPDNPIYIQLQSQMGEAGAQMQGVQAQTTALEAKVQDLQRLVLQTPALESEYSSLQQQYEAAVKRYQGFKDKEADAEVAQNMEQQSKSETFSVIEAPQFPELPVKPNRKMLLLVGVVLSGLLAGSIMLGLEIIDSKIYEPRGLHAAFGEVPLAMVPYISTRQERMGHRVRVSTLVLLAAGSVAAGLLAVHTFVMPLDVLVATFVNRINP
jgi:succinoglycan biosynthesis transport protein ExoP